MKKTLFSILPILILVSCNINNQDDYIEQYVVESYLIAHEELPNIQLTTTAPINVEYVKSERGVSNATVTVREFHPDSGPGSSPSELYTYIYVADGIYEPVTNGHTVKPRYRYDLDITINTDGHIIKASTVVPDTFVVNSINTTSLAYQGPEQFKLELSPSFFPGRQGYYVFSSQTLDPLNAELTPFYNDLDEDREDFYKISSGIINEASTSQNGSGTVELTLPWIAIAFYGPNRIRASAVDDNLYDLIRSAGIQMGGGTQSPGEIENIISNVEGGIGVFGSYAEIAVDVNVLKQ